MCGLDPDPATALCIYAEYKCYLFVDLFISLVYSFGGDNPYWDKSDHHVSSEVASLRHCVDECW